MYRKEGSATMALFSGDREMTMPCNFYSNLNTAYIKSFYNK